MSNPDLPDTHTSDESETKGPRDIESLRTIGAAGTRGTDSDPIDPRVLNTYPTPFGQQLEASNPDGTFDF